VSIVNKSIAADVAVKYGYPPKSITAAGSVLLSTIPITKGEQIIVTHQLEQASSSAVPAKAPATTTPAPSVKLQDAAVSAPTPPQAGPSSKGDSVTLPGDAGTLELRVVPDDNSCLFSAIGVIFEGGIKGGQELRRGESELAYLI
jgi:ubiquitin thioesterase OTU1